MAPSLAHQKRIECDTVIRFVRNAGRQFDYGLVNTTPEEPADIEYDGCEYQIVAGDFAFRATHGVVGRGSHAAMKEVPLSPPDPRRYVHAFIIEPLTKKQEKRYGRAAERVILLIDGRHCDPPHGFHRYLRTVKRKGVAELTADIGCPEVYVVAATCNVRVYP